MYKPESSNFLRKCEYMKKKIQSKIFQNFSNKFSLDSDRRVFYRLLVDRQIYKQIQRQICNIDRQTDVFSTKQGMIRFYISIIKLIFGKIEYRQMDRFIDRQMDRFIDRQMDRFIDRQMDIYIDRPKSLSKRF